MFCPKCDTKNPEDAVFCVGCGEKLEAYPEPEEETQPFIMEEIEEPEIKTMKCLYCDEENPEDAIFCIGCGANLGEKVKEMVVQPEKIEKEEFKIRCTKCSTLNRLEAEYCNVCGKPLIFRCTTCSTLNRLEAEYCNGCGKPLAFEYASVLRRATAVFIDWVVISIIYAFLLFVFPDVVIIPGLLLIVYITYFTVLEGPLNKGKTIGKIVVSIRVVKDVDRSMITYQDSLIRNSLRLADMFPYLIPYLVGFIAISSSEKYQRLGDRAANTIVIEA